MATHPGILLHLHTLPGGTGHCSLPILPDPSLTPLLWPHHRFRSVWGHPLEEMG